MNIRRAVEAEAAMLSALAMRAKAHWGYSTETMHQGLGRALLSHALATAADGGAREVIVDADPNAEPFYLECGAIRRGVVPAPISGQTERVRPQLAFVNL